MKGFVARLWVKAGPLLIEKHESPLIHAGRGLAKDRSRNSRAVLRLRASQGCAQAIYKLDSHLASNESIRSSDYVLFVER